MKICEQNFPQRLRLYTVKAEGSKLPARPIGKGWHFDVLICCLASLDVAGHMSIGEQKRSLATATAHGQQNFLQRLPM
jgi:hypothetical protein